MISCSIRSRGWRNPALLRFNGVNVGKVLAIALNRSDPSKVRVRIEVSSATPVRVGTQATLASQGVTGVAFVGLEGGAADAPRLTIAPGDEVAEIPSKPTVVQGLLEDAPDLLSKAISVLDDMGRFTTQDNADNISSIIANLDDATLRVNKVLDDLTRASASFVTASDQIAAFAGRLDTVAQSADDTLAAARKSLEGIDGFTAKLDEIAKGVDDTLGAARQTLAGIDAFANKGLPQFTTLAQQAQGLVADLSRLAVRIERDPARFFLGNQTPDYTR